MSLHFHREVDRLIEDLISFGEGIEDQLNESIAALLERDVKSAKRVIRNDGDMDQIEVEMEEECLKLLALHQPLASDLLSNSGPAEAEIFPIHFSDGLAAPTGFISVPARQSGRQNGSARSCPYRTSDRLTISAVHTP